MPDLAARPGPIVTRAPAAKSERLREFLAFNLAGDMYGLELARIREIVSPPPITEVPRAPGDVVGVCSVRGLLVTVVDLRRRLHLEERDSTRLSRILLSYTDSGEVVGLFVDEVLQVVRLNESEIEFAASVLGGDLSDHVMGIGRHAGDLIILLDLSSIVIG